VTIVFGNARPARHDVDMLNRIRRWLGWESNSSWLDPRTPLAPNKAKEPPAPPKTQVPPPSPRSSGPSRAQQPGADRPKKAREPLDVLNNPKLKLDKPADDGFDPYNTGAFNRSASWDKIGRQRKR
jgi:hypothetical protein